MQHIKPKCVIWKDNAENFHMNTSPNQIIIKLPEQCHVLLSPLQSI